MQQQQKDDDPDHSPCSETIQERHHHHQQQHHQHQQKHHSETTLHITSKGQLQVDEDLLIQHCKRSSTKNEHANCKYNSGGHCDSGAIQEKSLYMVSNKKDQNVSVTTTTTIDHNRPLLLSSEEQPVEIHPPTDFHDHDFHNAMTTTTTTTTTIYLQQLEQPQLHSMTTLQVAFNHADADAMDADVEQAKNSIFSRHQQTGSTEFYPGFTTDNQDMLMLVTAKHVVDSKCWKLLFVICLLIVGGVIAVVLIVVTSNHQSQQSDSTSPTEEQPMVAEHNQNKSSLPFWTNSPVNTTIGKEYGSHIGNSVLSVAFLYEPGQFYLRILDQQDIQFTVISFDIELVPRAISQTFLLRYLNPLWNGHCVSVQAFHAFFLWCFF